MSCSTLATIWESKLSETKSLHGLLDARASSRADCFAAQPALSKGAIATVRNKPPMVRESCARKSSE